MDIPTSPVFLSPAMNTFPLPNLACASLNMITPYTMVTQNLIKMMDRRSLIDLAAHTNFDKGGSVT